MLECDRRGQGRDILKGGKKIAGELPIYKHGAARDAGHGGAVRQPGFTSLRLSKQRREVAEGWTIGQGQ